MGFLEKQKKKRTLLVLAIVLAGATVGAMLLLLMQFGHTPAPKPQTQTKSTSIPTTEITSTAEITSTIPPVQDQLIQYDTLPGALRSSIKVNVDGQDVFVEQYKDSSYTRFAFTGTAKIQVTAADATAYTLSPRSYNIRPTLNGKTLALSLTEPRKLILQFGAEKLFVFADAPEQDAPHPGDAHVVDVTTFAHDTTGQAVQTAQIQQAIDEAARQQGIVYFPKGKYVSGTLNMKSNMALYLSSGTLLTSTGNVADTPQQFITFQDVKHAKLYGRGVVDLQGMAIRRSAGDSGHVKIIRTIHATDITLQDVIVRDSGSWTVHLLGSRDVKVDNLKIMNDPQNTNNDGIDPDGSSNVTIDGAFIYTTDDCFAVKTSEALHILQPTNNILIKNSVCYTKKSALKVGTETKDNLTNITFDHNNVVHADRVIALYMADGSTMDAIHYTNNWSEVVGGNAKQRLINIEISDRHGVGTINNVEITNYIAYEASPQMSVIAGMDGHIVNVVFKNLQIAGRQISSAADAMLTMQNANVTFVP